MKKSGLLWGCVVGFANGFFASGGGIVAVMLLQKKFRLDQAKSHATSIMIILPLTIAGIAVYTAGGFADIPAVLKTASGASAGALLGATLLSRIPPDYIRLGFGGAMILAAIKMIPG